MDLDFKTVQHYHKKGMFAYHALKKLYHFYGMFGRIRKKTHKKQVYSFISHDVKTGRSSKTKTIKRGHLRTIQKTICILRTIQKKYF